LPGFTPNENFPYPLTTDPFAVQPDDTGFPQQSRDLALAVQNKISAAPDFIRRRPFFKMSLNAPQTFSYSSSTSLAVLFDTIEVDTVGTVCNLSRNASGAFLTKGIWRVGCSVNISPTGTSGPTFGLVDLTLGTSLNVGNVFRAFPSTYSGTTYDGGGTINNYLSRGIVVYCNDILPTTAVASVSVQISPQSTLPPASGVQTATYGELWGFWVSDI